MKTDVSQCNSASLLSDTEDLSSSLFELKDDFVYIPKELAKTVVAADEGEMQFEVVENCSAEKDEFEWIDVPKVAQVRVNQEASYVVDPRFDRAKWWKAAIEGFSEETRGEMWYHFMLPQNRSLKEKYISLLNEKIEPKVKNIIELDIKRTFSFVPNFSANHSARLYNVLKVYSIYDPEVGYCQGMNYLAGVLLLYIPDESLAFALLADLMQRLNWRTLYVKEMPKLVELINTLHTSIKERLPELYTHLSQHDVNPFSVFSHLFLTTFLHATPFSFGVRIFELFLIAGEEVLVECAMGIMAAMKGEIMGRTADVHGYLKKEMIGECYAKYGSEFIISIFSDLN
eukprot:TRINITY_DN10469_c0_g1_i2.p1 TRINITY_DN10469_c0_g1~~TRINITY_DN10469_c0_g1_i2.p1  ORF type:complete len:343 (+),score=57.76 TRINITY_DN10469_c0_g1_i2:184-1212(+)